MSNLYHFCPHFSNDSSNPPKNIDQPEQSTSVSEPRYPNWRFPDNNLNGLYYCTNQRVSFVDENLGLSEHPTGTRGQLSALEQLNDVEEPQKENNVEESENDNLTFGKEFSTFEEAKKAIVDEARKTGDKVVKGYSWPLKNGTRKISFLCSRHKSLRKRGRRNTQADCDARVEIIFKNEKWVVPQLNLKHTHALSPMDYSVCRPSGTIEEAGAFSANFGRATSSKRPNFSEDPSGKPDFMNAFETLIHSNVLSEDDNSTLAKILSRLLNSQSLKKENSEVQKSIDSPPGLMDYLKQACSKYENRKTQAETKDMEISRHLAQLEEMRASKVGLSREMEEMKSEVMEKINFFLQNFRS